MIKHTLKKKPTPLATHAQPIDENAAELLADQLTLEDGQEVSEASAAVAVRAPEHPVLSGPPRISLPSNLGLRGDFMLSDLPIPQLKIIQGAGKMSERFTIGSVVYNDEVLFHAHEATPGKPLFRFIVARFEKFFKENLTQDEMASGMYARVVPNLDDVLALGGSLRRGRNGEKPRWAENAELVLLVEAPEKNESADFLFEVGGRRFGPAVFTTNSSSYEKFAKPIFSRSVLTQKPLDTMWWTFSVNKVKYGAHSVFCPLPKYVQEAVPAQVREIAMKFGA